MDWQNLRSVIGAATFAIALCACTRTPEPARLGADSERESLEDTRLCERYAQAAERVIKRQNSEPIDFLHDVDGPTSIPGQSQPARRAPPWTVRWSCTQKKLYLRTRLPHGVLLSAFGNGAEIILEDLVRGIRQDDLDPKADRLWIVVEMVDAEEKATFDPRQPYSYYR